MEGTALKSNVCTMGLPALAGSWTCDSLRLRLSRSSFSAESRANETATWEKPCEELVVTWVALGRPVRFWISGCVTSRSTCSGPAPGSVTSTNTEGNSTEGSSSWLILKMLITPAPIRIRLNRTTTARLPRHQRTIACIRGLLASPRQPSGHAGSYFSGLVNKMMAFLTPSTAGAVTCDICLSGCSRRVLVGTGIEGRGAVCRCLCLSSVGAGHDAGVTPLQAAQGHELLAFLGSAPRSKLLRIYALAGHQVGGQAHQSEIPADADSAGAELRPSFIVDVGDVFQFKASAAV